jgi:hypothetical protein
MMSTRLALNAHRHNNNVNCTMPIVYYFRISELFIFT